MYFQEEGGLDLLKLWICFLIHTLNVLANFRQSLFLFLNSNESYSLYIENNDVKHWLYAAGQSCYSLILDCLERGGALSIFNYYITDVGQICDVKLPPNAKLVLVSAHIIQNLQY